MLRFIIPVIARARPKTLSIASVHCELITLFGSMIVGAHDNSQLSVAIGGRAGGQLKTGRMLDYLESRNERWPASISA